MDESPNMWKRLIVGLVIFGAVYYLSLYLIPDIGPIRGFVQRTGWMGSGTVTQICYLVFSLMLIRFLGKGRFSEFGFRGTSVRALGRAVLVALGVSVVVIFVNMVIMAAVYGPSGPPGDGGISGGWLRRIITVWIIASTCEEIFYRGFLLNFLKALRTYGFRLLRWRVSLPVLVAALTFGLGHLCLLCMMPAGVVGGVVVSCFICGLIAGGFAEKTGSIIPAVAVHMVFNITGMMLPTLMMALAG
jgi:membrane protease YdiL (CAAX protease family)